jgi:predicted CXXCH cytochrome family protein
MAIKAKLIVSCLICLVVSAVTISGSRSSGSKTRVERSRLARAAQHKKIGKTECTDCHGDLVKHKTMHAPAEGCDTCHDYSEQGSTAQVKLAVEGNDLCFTCHTEKQEEMQSKKSKHPPAEDNCTNCHDPHSTDYPRMLKAAISELCVTCHTERQEEFDTKKFVHPPVKELGCTTCHNPHATDFKPLLKAAVINVCLACHKLNAVSDTPRVGDEKLLIFPETRIPADYPNRAKKVILGSDGRGHPFIGHPVSGVADPSRKDRELACTSCHNPHAGNFVQMFQKDIRGQALCLRCHK